MSVHGYYADKAAVALARAGGDSDVAGPLAAWAEAQARIGSDPSVGVLVAEDGLLLAETQHTSGPGEPGGSYVTKVLISDALMVKGVPVDLACADMRNLLGMGVTHVKISDVTHGSGEYAREVLARVKADVAARAAADEKRLITAAREALAAGRGERGVADALGWSRQKLRVKLGKDTWS